MKVYNLSNGFLRHHFSFPVRTGIIFCEIVVFLCLFVFQEVEPAVISNTPTLGTPSGSYVIDPDGEGGEKPFKDFCDTADEDSVGVTVVSHDSENRTLVDGFQDPGSYSCNVTYQGISRTASSVHCEQFLM